MSRFLQKPELPAHAGGSHSTATRVLDLAEFRIAGEDRCLHLLRQGHNEGIGIGDRVVRLDVRGGEGQPAVGFDDLDG